jgi:AraC-like DNA-binding protein
LVRKKTKYLHLGLQIYILKSFASKASFNGLLMPDWFSIVIVNVGTFSIAVNNGAITVKENELLVIPIQSSCEIIIISDPLQLSLLSFTSEFVLKNSIRKPYIGYFEFFIAHLSSKILLKDKHLLLLTNLFAMLDSKMVRSNSHVFKNETILFSFNLLLYELAALYYKSTWHRSVHHTQKEKVTLQFLKILEKNCKEQHGVKFYADSLCISTDYLSKIVRQITEKTAKQFIEEALVLEAKILLQNHQLTIMDIAAELQFSSSSFFSTFFKKHTSFSPSQYRFRLNFD